MIISGFSNNPEIEQIIGMVDFYSLTVRAFKLPDLEDLCEDYGQVATYHGTIPDWPHFFDLDSWFKSIKYQMFSELYGQSFYVKSLPHVLWQVQKRQIFDGN